MSVKLRFFYLLLFLLLTCCDSTEMLAPRQRGYPKIEFPTGKLVAFNNPAIPVHFQYPDYLMVTKDSSLTGDLRTKDNWFNLQLPALNASIHFSYYPITKERQLEKLVNDAFKMASFHNKKANYIDEIQLNISPDVTGMEFYIKGPAATPYQFYLTDREKHFLRGVFYVKAQVNIDSLAPVHAFMIKDIQKIIDGFSWDN
ncbi:MAG: hypothetical protein KGQ86_01970 [Bacteroidetes bacterium]|nr:hypothetical protein [Bacteroidota bacterium]